MSAISAMDRECASIQSLQVVSTFVERSGAIKTMPSGLPEAPRVEAAAKACAAGRGLEVSRSRLARRSRTDRCEPQLVPKTFVAKTYELADGDNPAPDIRSEQWFDVGRVDVQRAAFELQCEGERSPACRTGRPRAQAKHSAPALLRLLPLPVPAGLRVDLRYVVGADPAKFTRAVRERPSRPSGSHPAR